MNPRFRPVLGLLLALGAPALAAELPPLPAAPSVPSAPSATAIPVAPSAPTVPGAPASALFTAEQLDLLLGPVALYPDALLALILPASTSPSEIVLAARFLQAGNSPAQAEAHAWDDSVRSLVYYPDTIRWMDENLAWTKQLGEAFLAQPEDVMAAIQRLRFRALQAGSLFSNAQQQVVVEGSAIKILPAQPEVIFAPYYNPSIVYLPRSAYPDFDAPLLSYGSGFAAGIWLSYGLDWPARRIWVIDRHERERHWREHRDWRPGQPPPPHRPGVTGPPPWHVWRPAPDRPRPPQPSNLPPRPRPDVTQPAPYSGAPRFASPPPAGPPSREPISNRPRMSFPAPAPRSNNTPVPPSNATYNVTGPTAAPAPATPTTPAPAPGDATTPQPQRRPRLPRETVPAAAPATVTGPAAAPAAAPMQFAPTPRTSDPRPAPATRPAYTEPRTRSSPPPATPPASTPPPAAKAPPAVPATPPPATAPTKDSTDPRKKNEVERE